MGGKTFAPEAAVDDLVRPWTSAEAASRGRDLVHHSDRGSHYASHDYRDASDRAGMMCSMSRRGKCWGNAVAESFFGTLKTELLQQLPLQTRQATQETVADSIETSTAFGHPDSAGPNVGVRVRQPAHAMRTNTRLEVAAAQAPFGRAWSANAIPCARRSRSPGVKPARPASVSAPNG